MNKEQSLPLVTVITSVFNGAATLEAAIQSVLQQTYPAIEFLIIDGGSTDDTLKIVKAYETQITRWVSEPDKGIYDAWNKGLSIAQGEWICFLGADDVFTPNAIAGMVQVALDTPEPLEYISGRTELIKNGQTWKITGGPWEWSKFQRYVCTGHNGALHHRRLFDRYGTYDIQFKSAGDYDLLLRPGPALRTGYVDLITTRMAMGGVSNQSNRALWERYAVILKNGFTPKYIAFYHHVRSLVLWKLRSLLRAGDR